MVFHGDDPNRLTIRVYAGEALVVEHEVRWLASGGWDPDYWQPTAEALPVRVLQLIEAVLSHAD